MDKAVFLDRDGVINELIYYREHGVIDSPFTPGQFKLIPGVLEAIRELKGDGYKVVLVSNQPGVAKGHMDKEIFEAIRRKMNDLLAGEGASLDGEYYCLHHPEASVASLKKSCECRKPKPGLLLQAARELDIDVKQSWMVGDGLTDIQAGRSAGCKTMLIGRMKCELCNMMDEENARPIAIAASLEAAADYIIKSGG